MNEEEVYKIIVKVIIPAIIIALVSVAVEIKKGVATFWNSFLSVLISVGGAYIFSDWILAAVPDKYITLTVALVAIVIDKFMNWLLFEFKVDELMTKLTEILLNRLKNKK